MKRIESSFVEVASVATDSHAVWFRFTPRRHRRQPTIGSLRVALPL
jgi:hypothetical protein